MTDYIYNILVNNKIPLLMTLVFICLERFSSKKRYLEYRKQSWLLNLGYYILNEFILAGPLFGILNTVVLVALVKWRSQHVSGPLFAANLNEFWMITGALLLYDTLQFHTHLLFHKINFLWEFHKVHHSSQYLTVTSDWRYHFMESIIFFFTAEAPLIFLGFSAEAILVKNLVSQFLSCFVHWDTKLILPGISKFFPTPQIHLWHHAEEIKTKFAQQNIGSLTSFWDRVYGTYYFNPESPKSLSFAEIEKYPSNVLLQFINPAKIFIKKLL